MGFHHCMVGTVGLEPTRDILPTDFKSVASAYFATIPLEVPTRFELVITELQSIALPLGYGTIYGSTAIILYTKSNKMQH